jgi:cytochrome b
MVQTATGMVRVWDPLVRLGHWVLVAAFFVAYLTEDELLGIHVWAGYIAGTIVLLRIVWGFLGPLHARFSDFVHGPARILAYLRDLLLFRAPRHLGHSPAGGAMVIALLLSVGATVGTGLLTYGAEHRGPLAPFFTAGENPGLALIAPAVADEERGRVSGGAREEPGGKAFEDIHEFFANLTLVLILLHVAGVGLASIVHRENLVRAMMTGNKRADG